MEKPPHGNSKKSQKPQHVYEIRDVDLDKVAKYGISGLPLNTDGSSPRANSQVNRLNRFAEFKKFITQILFKDIDDRAKALEIEYELVRQFKIEHNNDLPDIQKRPNPPLDKERIL